MRSHFFTDLFYAANDSFRVEPAGGFKEDILC